MLRLPVPLDNQQTASTMLPTDVGTNDGQVFALLSRAFGSGDTLLTVRTPWYELRLQSRQSPK